MSSRSNFFFGGSLIYFDYRLAFDTRAVIERDLVCSNDFNIIIHVVAIHPLKEHFEIPLVLVNSFSLPSLLFLHKIILTYLVKEQHLPLLRAILFEDDYILIP
jgi:hypothetical protein